MKWWSVNNLHINVPSHQPVMLHLCPELKIYNSYIYILYRRRKLLMNYSTIATSGSSYLSAQSPPEEERLSWNTHESWQFTDSKELYRCINGGYVFNGCWIQKYVRTWHWWTRDILVNIYVFKYCIYLPSLPSAFTSLIILPGINACTMVSQISMKYWRIKASAQAAQRITATSPLFSAESNFQRVHI